MRRSASRLNRKPPKQPIRQQVSKYSASISSGLPGMLLPALKMARSIGPWLSAASTKAATEDSSVVSATTAVAFPPAARIASATASTLASVRPPTKTWRPSLAAMRHTAAPSPSPAPTPITIAVLPMPLSLSSQSRRPAARRESTDLRLRHHANSVQSIIGSGRRPRPPRRSLAPGPGSPVRLRAGAQSPGKRRRTHSTHACARAP